MNDDIEGDGGRRSSPRRRDAYGKAERAADELGALVRDHPVGALATAVGVGYAVGGGLFTRLTSRLVQVAFRLGVKLALLPMLERELAAWAGGSPLEPPAGGDRGASGPDRTRH
jgi:hypothetical protein